ncbi:SusD/RagB family nutrient-binding outer membrane lipoprotein [Pontibacter mangrovi]|uniref:SusD/RagB family nutrient-binding outer membrane lipoprotein n=1 Tax=Pontibacter mangrovi TaxID=2589816 RepID=A0A501VTJ1_9BACT|nr:SusD/RagB family nutrient-binding outer membrane lipoprotein [Pontibacter mangrovi]TPE41053.1 SusD/RagB family nutrient-binding outer membrane lipoprotein [Pontibacter mangrovi]
MTKYNRILLLFLGLSCMGVATTSCNDHLEELNIDPNRVDKINPGTLLNPIIYEMSTFGTSRANAFTFEIMQVRVPFPSAAGGEHRYVITQGAGNSTWNASYRWLLNVKEMEQAAIEAEAPNYQAIALTLKAWIYSNLTDAFGDVPMREAVSAEAGILRPAFDTQEDIYKTLLADLEKANSLYDEEQPMAYGTDLLYGNDISNWQRFTNSLRLRLLLRVSKRAEMNSFERMAAIINNPEESPVFTSNSQAAILQITGVDPNMSPWGRPSDFTLNTVGSEFFIDNLNEMNDPRVEKFYTEAKTNDGNAMGYKGVPSGYDPAQQFDYVPSGMNTKLVTAPMISVIMSYAEVEFIKAELAQKGVISDDAQAHYQAGVEAAIEQWGAEVPADYFENPAAAYDGTFERIMLQKYLALVFNDYQQWYEYRRTGLPVLPKTTAMENDQQVPVRFLYPEEVKIYNRDNYEAAVNRMGGDDINTKGWWEKD